MRKYLFFLIFTIIVTFVHAQWQPTNGPSGGVISSIVAKGNKIFVGTYYGGIYFSSNYGITWIDVSPSLPTNAFVTSFYLCGDTILAGIHLDNPYQATGGSVYFSANNGSIWSAIGVNLPAAYGVNTITKSGNRVFVGTPQQGIYSSSDNGNSWGS